MADLDLSRYPHVSLLGAIWAPRHKPSVYDAAYVALADLLGARLLTFDLRLASAVRSRTDVRLVEVR